MLNDYEEEALTPRPPVANRPAAAAPPQVSTPSIRKDCRILWKAQGTIDTIYAPGRIYLTDLPRFWGIICTRD